LPQVFFARNKLMSFKALCVCSLVGAAALGQGPDVIVGSLNGVASWGSSGSIYAYSIGTTSCNIGTQNLAWIAGTNQHPVIAQNIYRLKPVTGQSYSRFEHIGQSWLKHGFFALSGTLCGGCPVPTDGSSLGVGCSDPYDAGLNGDQGLLGPRNEVNAASGYFPYPWGGGYPAAAPTIGRRIQCAANDVNPALNAGAVYFGEGQYVHPEDAGANNSNNSASYRAMAFANNATFSASFTGGTIQQQPGVLAWKNTDPAVVITYVDVPFDGRFIVAKKVTSLGGGNHHFEFAVQNLDSDRSGRGFTVSFAPGTVISNAGFKDIGYHSGEPYSGTDWTPAINGASVNWATQTYAQNVNANALRWGTLYNFWFDATASGETSADIELFKPCPADPTFSTNVNSYILDTAAPFDNPAITGTNGPTGDDAATLVPIGFTFNYFGTNYTQASVCTNGFIQLGSTSTEYSNQCLPSGGAPNGVIAAYWDDLVAPAASTVRYQTIGLAPNRRFVVWWNGIQIFGNPGSLQSFKVILDETSNKITSTIISSADGGASATRGIENATGTTGVQASCNTPGSAIANTSQAYTPGIVIPKSADLEISGSTGPNGVLTFDINSNANSAPVVLVASLDPTPTNLGALGILELSLTMGAYAILADGAGALQPANPGDFTTPACGTYTLSLPLGPGGLPPGLNVNVQGVVISTSTIPPPPNGAFHWTDMEQITT
jgi:hypothetical protein